VTARTISLGLGDTLEGVDGKLVVLELKGPTGAAARKEDGFAGKDGARA